MDTNKMIEEAKYVFALSVDSVKKHRNTYLIGIAAAMLSHLSYLAYSYYTSDAYRIERNVTIARERIGYANGRIDYAKPIWEEAVGLKNSAEECERLNLSGSVTDCETYVSSGSLSYQEGLAQPEFESTHVEYAPPKLLNPSELFGPTKLTDKCYISQTESEHVIPKNGGMFATDIACNFGEGLGKRAEIYAPDLRNEVVMWQVAHVGQDELLGLFVQLQVITDNAYQKRAGKEPNGGELGDESFYLAHVETKLKVGDVVTTGQRIGQMILNGATTGWHVHVEYRRLSADGTTWKSERYFTGKREEALDNKRKNQLPTGHNWGDEFYFTSYNLGDVNQNDSSPCHGASGKNLCDMLSGGKKPIALTADVRKSLGVKFGDKVRLVGACTDEYVIEDEMNSRFRFACIEKDGVCIKGDIAIPKGTKGSCSGKYVIEKV